MTSYSTIWCVILSALIIGMILYSIIETIKTCKESFSNVKDNFQDTTSKFLTRDKLSQAEKLGSLYTPIIVRPRDTLTDYKNSKLLKGEMSAPSNPEIEAKYYAMRPILTPQSYEKMIKVLFENIVQEVPSNIDEQSLTHQTQFCNGECYSNVMKYIMVLINTGKDTLEIFKDYAKKDTWGGEQFAFLNESVIMFSSIDLSNVSEQNQAKLARYSKLTGPFKYVITFTLHNTLRSSSIDIVAIVIESNKRFYLKYINFASRDPTNPVQGINISTSAGRSPGIDLNNSDLPPVQNTPNWIYGNNIENRTFNLKGYHDPEESNNILIPGGVPAEFEGILTTCDQGYLLDPANTTGPRMKGGYSSNDATKATPVYPDYPNTDKKWDVYV